MNQIVVPEVFKNMSHTKSTYTIYIEKIVVCGYTGAVNVGTVLFWVSTARYISLGTCLYLVYIGVRNCIPVYPSGYNYARPCTPGDKHECLSLGVYVISQGTFA